MIVAVIAVRVVQVAVDQVVDVVAMGNRFVTAPGTVDMARIVPCGMLWRAAIRVGLADFERVLFHRTVRTLVVQVTVVEVVRVAVVVDSLMATFRAVLVGVIFVRVRHENPF